MHNDRITVKEAKEKAMQWCSRRECCRKDMFEKVVSWGCTPVEAQDVIDFLVKQRFIDDRRYAEAYVKDKLRFSKWGRVKISYMLRSQGIDDIIIREISAEIDDNEYEQTLKAELTKKYKTLRRGNAYETRGKLFRFAVSRGFETDIINTVIPQIDSSLEG